MQVKEQQKTKPFAVYPPTLEWEENLRKEAARLGLKPTGFLIHLANLHFTQTAKADA